MKMTSLGFRLGAVFTAALVLGAAGWADEPPDVGPNLAAQSAADILRAYTGADGAFIHAGILKSSVNRDDLATYLSYPTDPISVMSLTGKQVREALEFAVSLYPESNYSFLQLSGFDVLFKKSGPAEHRIVSLTLNGVPVSDGAKYTVAMPSLLARGAVGYSRYWGKDRPVKEFGNTTMEDILKGKKAVDGSPRWTAQN